MRLGLKDLSKGYVIYNAIKWPILFLASATLLGSSVEKPQLTPTSFREGLNQPGLHLLIEHENRMVTASGPEIPYTPPETPYQPSERAILPGRNMFDNSYSPLEQRKAL